ncbi:NAD(P)H-dependent FMN reductase [Lactobacillus colini]|uniref:NAD(P)H-dependent FMN reductase n=1 Tax=Lactobacillus colini TaxID=1819254 RepID=A0ABS4MBW2_9LACO|nr:NADPH-dependent FMN reductase [Lactobacillus colini]MBP2057158.1 NAD(P)H-dependent FMN reductase [Lactobacillus colini]
MTKQITFIVGSLRKDSFNKTLANYIIEKLSKIDFKIEFASIGDIPLMNQDIEFPAPVAVSTLRTQVENSDALWIVSPEYNGTIPGVLKNALDWLSRPVQQGTFGAPEFLINKPVAISGAGGKDAAAGFIHDLVKLMKFMGLAPFEETVGLQIPTEAFMTNKFELSDEQKAKIDKQIQDFIDSLDEKN